MLEVELILGLLAAVVVLVLVARRLGIAYPILLVLGGLVLGLVPQLPHVQLDPDVVFVLFVPPLVYSAAFPTAWREFRLNLPPILSLAVGLVLATMLAVAATMHASVPGFAWTAAFVLGAIVSPSDAVSVMAVTERVPIPGRVTTILEGESLANDAMSLVAYRMAVAAAVAGSFSLRRAGLWFLWAALGGVAYGWALGWVVVQVRRRLRYPPVEILISLLTPFAAFLPADAVGASGVLAVLATGLYIGRRRMDAMSAEVRVRGFAFWDILVFLLNGLAFILIGLQLRTIMAELAGIPIHTLLADAALVSGVVIGVRLLWVFGSAYGLRLLSPWLRRHQPPPLWKDALLVAWGGMRGIDSLVTALAVPLATRAGQPFPQRNLIVFLSFGVILATLVLQGLSLPLLGRWLGRPVSDSEEHEEIVARLRAARAGLHRLNSLARESHAPRELIEFLRGLVARRVRLFEARLLLGKHEELDAREEAERRVMRDLLRAERAAVTELRDREVISDEVLRRVVEDLDLEELRLEE